MAACPQCGSEQGFSSFCRACAGAMQSRSQARGIGPYVLAGVALMVILAWNASKDHLALSGIASVAAPPQPAPLIQDEAAAVIARCGKPDRDKISMATKGSAEKRVITYKRRQVQIVFSPIVGSG